MSTKIDTAASRAPTQRGEDMTDLDETLATLSDLAVDDEFEPEPPCRHCVAAQALSADPQGMCDVHAQQSLPYVSPLQHHAADGPEKQRQDAWILY